MSTVRPDQAAASFDSAREHHSQDSAALPGPDSLGGLPAALSPNPGLDFAPGLGKKGTTETPPPVREPGDASRALWDAFRWLGLNSSLPSVQCCRRTPIAFGGYSSMAGLNISTGGRARWASLKTCGSVWACPMCSARTWAHRSLKLEAVLGAASEQGHRATLTTLTMRHRKGQALPDLWGDGLSTAWHRLNNDRTIKKLRKQAGWVGSIRRTEVTHGRNGWHVHAHVLDLWRLDPPTQPYRDACSAAWVAGLALRGLEASTGTVGTDLRPVHLGEKTNRELANYVTAGTGMRERVALELTDALKTKQAKGDNRTPFELLAGAMAGDAGDRRLWAEWETGSKGRRALLMSKGIRENYGDDLDAALDLDAPLERELEVVAMTAELWTSLLAVTCPGAVAGIAERGWAAYDDLGDDYWRLFGAQMAVLEHLDDLGLNDPARLHLPDPSAATALSAGPEALKVPPLPGPPEGLPQLFEVPSFVLAS